MCSARGLDQLRTVTGLNCSIKTIQPTKFDRVINPKTAKALGLTVSNQMQLLADEVIE
jgi:hypothetical protein